MTRCGSADPASCADLALRFPAVGLGVHCEGLSSTTLSDLLRFMPLVTTAPTGGEVVRVTNMRAHAPSWNAEQEPGWSAAPSLQIAGEGRLALDWTGRRIGIWPRSNDPSATWQLWSRALLAGLAMADCLAIHGGLVAIKGRGVAILGASGAGKSTTVAATLAAGARVLTDDLFLLDCRDQRHLATPLRKPLLFRGRTSRLLPSDMRKCLSVDPDSGRDRLLPEDYPGCFVERVSVDEIWVLGAGGHPAVSAINAAAEADTLAALCRAASPALLGQATKPMRLLSAVVQQRPGLDLVAGHDLLDSPVSTVGSLLRSVLVRGR